MAQSGYDYQMVKREMLKFENVDPRELVNRPKRKRQNQPGCKVFYTFKFDPRLPHPRKIISKNYEILARNETAKALFPRSNLIASGKRLPNLGEILSPTVQPPRPRTGSGPPADGQDGPDLPANTRGRGRGRGAGGRVRGRGRGHSQPPAGAAGGEESDLPASGQVGASQPALTQNNQSNGTYHCDYHTKSRGKCDTCSHMIERRSIFSSHFRRNHAIAGHNVHRKASEKPKLKWFVYLEECIHPEGIFQYVGSTNSMVERWATTKSKCLAKDSEGTGLEKHYKDGCSAEQPALGNIRVSLLEQFNTSVTRLQNAVHRPGPGCVCKECDSLKELESKWIHRLGTLHGQFGLNNKNEMHRKVRASY